MRKLGSAIFAIFIGAPAKAGVLFVIVTAGEQRPLSCRILLFVLYLKFERRFCQWTIYGKREAA